MTKTTAMLARSSNPFTRMGRIGLCLICTTALAGCDISALGIPGFDRGPNLATVPVEPAPDSNGVIDFGNFRVITARQGDTIGKMAARIRMPDVVLARYNGLPTGHILRPGERLAIPDEAQIAAVQEGWTPEVVTGVLDRLPSVEVSPSPPKAAPGTQLLRHQVESGETVYSIAQLHGVSATALASWNGLKGDLKVTRGQSLIIPPTGGVIPEKVPEPDNEPGTDTEIAPPPSAVAPLPKNDSVKAPELEKPDLNQSAPEPRKVNSQFALPVKGKIIKPYSTAKGRKQNEGIDYQTTAKASVKAADHGEVALVSRSLGGLGTIVLVRHADDLMSVYGRIDDVAVKKGQKIRRGQKIGVVANNTPSIFHFEIRRGTQSIDPTPFLPRP